MRIVAGTLGGRTFDAPRGHRTHPMSDKIRGALFNALGDIQGLEVLDAYAGSGAIAFEAVSRGAKNVIATDPDKSAYEAIKKNVNTLGVTDSVQVVKAYIHSWMNRWPNKQFDIVIADPPYDDLVYKTLDKLHTLVKPSGVLVYSLPPKTRLILPDSCVKITEKNYGDATLTFYRVN